MHLKRAAAPLVARLCGGTQAEILGHDNRETASTGSAGTETLAEPKQVEVVVDGIREEVEVLSEHSSDSYFTDTDTDEQLAGQKEEQTQRLEKIKHTLYFYTEERRHTLPSHSAAATPSPPPFFTAARSVRSRRKTKTPLVAVHAMEESRQGVVHSHC